MPTTTYKGYSVPTTGSESGTWGTDLNNNTFSVMDTNVGGISSISLSNANVTLNTAQNQSAILYLTGTLSANIIITTACQGFFFVDNQTSGAYTVTITNGVSGITAPQGSRSTMIADATYGVRLAGTGDFASGTSTFFKQTSAPLGWTKQTSLNDYALRMVSGTPGTGGSVPFSTAFASQTISGTVGDTALTINQLPAHTHSYTAGAGVFNASGGNSSNTASSVPSSQTSGSTGSGATHTHTFTGNSLNLAVQYADVIWCIKN